jgi:hypothetical protein
MGGGGASANESKGGSTASTKGGANMITVVMEDGREGIIPENEWPNFKAKHKKAKKK